MTIRGEAINGSTGVTCWSFLYKSITTLSFGIKTLMYQNLDVKEQSSLTLGFTVCGPVLGFNYKNYGMLGFGSLIKESHHVLFPISVKSFLSPSRPLRRFLMVTDKGHQIQLSLGWLCKVIDTKHSSKGFFVNIIVIVWEYMIKPLCIMRRQYFTKLDR